MGRFIFIVLDGVGVGALPDAAEYGDSGSDTLGNLSRVIPLRLPFLEACGLGNIVPIGGVRPVGDPLCLPGRLAPRSAGKDTTVGHWEHMGLVTPEPFPTYPKGFPDELISLFAESIGRGVLGNKPASGTAIIEELGEEHIVTGRPIVYTSADSVFQIAAHVEVVPLELLYTWCRAARQILSGRHKVARVIARPFQGDPGCFVRTGDRRDFSLEPPGPTYLDRLQESGVPVVALGKITEVFAGRGISTQIKVVSNEENLSVLGASIDGRKPPTDFPEGLLMTNLVEFDMVWGHRNDVDGFVEGLEAVDAALPGIFERLGPDDTLLLTADHGVDPTTPSTDHSREYVPLLLFPRPVDAPDATYEGSFADTGATMYEFLTGRHGDLEGTAISRLRPQRGWRDYAPRPWADAECRQNLCARVGPRESEAAGRWLAENAGEPPIAAVVLGSGLMVRLDGAPLLEVPYQRIPHWRIGTVAGHAYTLILVQSGQRKLALLKGRVHGYEGYDESEIQLPVRSLSAWGVRNLILTSASGAVIEGLHGGEVVCVDEVLELGWSSGTQAAMREALIVHTPAVRGLRHGTHASLPGPQYETPAELALLRHLGAATVSMSPAAELRAAQAEGMTVAVLAVVANSGDTTHEEVLLSTMGAADGLGLALESLLEAWVVPT